MANIRKYRYVFILQEYTNKEVLVTERFFDTKSLVTASNCEESCIPIKAVAIGLNPFNLHASRH